MTLKDKLIVALEQAYRQQVAFVENLPAEAMAATGTPDDWAPKDMVAHMTEWSRRLADDLDRWARGEPLPRYGPDEEENAAIFAEYQSAPWDEVRRLMAETHARQIAHLRAADDDALSNPARSPWQDDTPLFHQFVGTCVTHVLLHLAGYEVAHGHADRAILSVEALPPALLDLDSSPRWQGAVYYNEACFYTLAGYPAQAVSRLGEALRLNPRLVEWSKIDGDLASLRDRADYQALYADRAE